MTIANDPHLPSCGINTSGECDCGEWDEVPFDLPPAWQRGTQTTAQRKQPTFVDRPLRALLYMAVASVIGGFLGWALAGIYILIWG